MSSDGLCLLSFDGGGVRRLSTLYILREIMAALNHAREEAGLPNVKPCETFDLIGGTSTGGYVVLLFAAYGRFYSLRSHSSCLHADKFQFDRDNARATRNGC
jgi:patatin-like phospholipase/acyl hydrolase